MQKLSSDKVHAQIHHTSLFYIQGMFNMFSTFTFRDAHDQKFGFGLAQQKILVSNYLITSEMYQVYKNIHHYVITSCYR